TPRAGPAISSRPGARMRFSRLRLQLAAWFALVFVLGLGAVDLAFFSSLKRDTDRELTSAARGAVLGLRLAVQRELHAENKGDLRGATTEALTEWPPDSAGIAIFS